MGAGFAGGQAVTKHSPCLLTCHSSAVDEEAEQGLAAWRQLSLASWLQKLAVAIGVFPPWASLMAAAACP